MKHSFPRLAVGETEVGRLGVAPCEVSSCDPRHGEREREWVVEVARLIYGSNENTPKRPGRGSGGPRYLRTFE